MKNLLIISAFILSFYSYGAAKVGEVNIQKVLVTVKLGKKIKKTLETSYNSMKSKLKKDEDSIKKMQKDFQKQSMVLSDKAKAKKEKAIRMKIAEIQKKTMEFQKKIQKQEIELKKPLLEKLQPVINSVSKLEKLDMTFALQGSPLLYAGSKVDITDKVIKAFDKKYK
ncbi:MAG: OmpH family outer membrane protein [Bacteriovoracaceae bacterium]|jgi:outer membrane protein|nr:OmpH family outer membrane protein [Bacteriovoracaceae bacterium]